VAVGISCQKGDGLSWEICWEIMGTSQPYSMAQGITWIQDLKAHGIPWHPMASHGIPGPWRLLLVLHINL